MAGGNERPRLGGRGLSSGFGGRAQDERLPDIQFPANCSRDARQTCGQQAKRARLWDGGDSVTADGTAEGEVRGSAATEGTIDEEVRQAGAEKIAACNAECTCTTSSCDRNGTTGEGPVSPGAAQWPCGEGNGTVVARGAEINRKDCGSQSNASTAAYTSRNRSGGAAADDAPS